ncbi:MAG TPA: hypothetical protein VKE50_00695 [Thermoanaerobaculia bacterium]|nr:hypothetical protein [Thermoanaerobaculia bacterium]
MIEGIRRRSAAAASLAGTLLAFLTSEIYIAQASGIPGGPAAVVSQPEALPALELGKPIEGALDLARRGGDRLGEGRAHNDLALVRPDR